MGLESVLNGRPTGPEVSKIMAVCPLVSNGEVLRHDELEAMVGATRKEARYRTVVNAWRKRIERERCIVPEAVRGTGYRLPTGPEQLKNGIRTDIAIGARRIGKGVKRIAMVTDDRLPDGRDRENRNAIVSTARYLHERARAVTRELNLTVGKPEALPQRTT